MKYKHFSVEEREKIQRGLWEKRSIRTIAKDLGRSPASVSRELRRNYPDCRKAYFPRSAHERALQKRKSRGRKDRLKTRRIRRYVITHLKQKWSPEQISGRIKREHNFSISHEAIYQFIYAQIHRDGYGYPRPGCEDLRAYLRRRHRRRVPHGARRCQRVLQPKGPSIDERPAIVGTRSRVGDWESDTVAGPDNQVGINTLVDRKTGRVCITKLADKTSRATALTIERRLRHLKSQTITFDNGSENQTWEYVERKVKVQCFFAHPYHSWERGTNENTNGLIRQYFPKRTDFTGVSLEAIAAVEAALNHRPRKRLGWKTPLEAWSESVALQG